MTSTLIALLISLSPVPTINLTDVPNIDTLPECTVEDCSDLSADQFPAVWYNQGNWYLATSADAPSWTLIVDNTTR